LLLTTTMSDFKALKSARNQKSSFVSAQKISQHVAVGEGGTPEAPEGAIDKEATTIENALEPAPSTSSPPPPANDLYKSIPPTLEIRSSEGRGRGLHAKIHLKPGVSASFHAPAEIKRSTPGDVLLSVKPHVAVLSITHLDGYCSSCFGAGNGGELKRCTGCKTVRYCSPVSYARWIYEVMMLIPRSELSNKGLVFPQERVQGIARLVQCRVSTVVIPCR